MGRARVRCRGAIRENLNNHGIADTEHGETVSTPRDDVHEPRFVCAQQEMLYRTGHTSLALEMIVNSNPSLCFRTVWGRYIGWHERGRADTGVPAATRIAFTDSHHANGDAMNGQLTSAQTEQLARLLAERRAALTAAIDSHLEAQERTGYSDLVGQVGDLEDHALAELLVDAELAGIQREIADLRDVQAAEERLALGTCGTCIDCGEAIDFERLQASPTATRCLVCQKRHEKTHAQPGHPTL